MMNKANFKPIVLFALVFFSIVLFETTFRLLILELPINLNYYKVLLFSATYSMFIIMILRLLGPRLMKIILCISILLISTFYFAQTIYYLSMGSLFSFNMAGDASKGFAFVPYVINYIHIVHAIYLIPFIGIIILHITHKRFKDSVFDLFSVRYFSVKPVLFALVLTLFLSYMSTFAISSSPFADNGGDDIPTYSERDLFDTNFSPELSVNRFGLFTYARIDLRSTLNFSEKNEKTDDWLINYYEEREKKSNDYTGIFEDKNLIFITAESLASYAIDPYLMPNLSKMMENSMVFDNYYAPLYYRNTADTEFMMHTSFYPSANVPLSMKYFQNNLLPSTLPESFKQAGFETIAHHNYSDFYYPSRAPFYKELLGFEDYLNAYDMGLIEHGTINENIEDEQIPWQSDKEMFEATLDDLLEKDSFFAYYLTVSGHLPYDDSHEVAKENLPIIEEIFEENNRPFDDEIMMYYYAANYELDLALGVLLEKLEETGQKDDTVIVVASDHYPYGIEDDVIHQHAPDLNLDETRLNIHNVPFFIYHPSLDQKHYDNLMSSVDMMPTIGNLFNLDMDYEKFMGQDVFEDRFKLIRFQDSSVMSSYYTVEANMDLEVVQFDDTYDYDRIMRHYNEAIHRHQLNLYILETDFFRRLEHKLKP